jgi:polyribonucleotide nucleotidyltransferase
VKEVKDELREGDQVMVKVLAIEGNRIKLSRKALIKEQKAKLAQSAPAQAEEVEYTQPVVPAAPPSPRSTAPRNEFDERQPSSNQSTILIEGGDDFEEENGVELDETNEPNFNRVDGAPVVHAGGPQFGGGRPGSGAGAGVNNRRRRRRRGGRGPGGGQG